jgi:hypothetical protein
MAPNNPSVSPTEARDFRSYSDPIKVPDTIKPQGVQQNQILPRGQEIGDRSAEYLGKAEAYKMQGEGTGFEAYADLFKNLTQMGDFVGKANVAITKKEIEDKVYQVASEERNEYTSTLEKIKQTGVSKILSEGPEEGAAETPDEVSTLGDTLSTLKSAKDAGKISSSYYYGRLNEKAKGLRAQYPGFKQEIDNEFAKVTGVNPANAYVRALTQDINRGASAASSEQKKAVSFIAQRNGYPNAQVMMQAAERGGLRLSQAMEWAAPYEREDYELKRRSAVFQDNNITRETQKIKVGELFDFAASTAVSRSVDTMSGRMGIYSAEDASKLDTAVKAGIVPQAQWVTWGQELAGHKTQLELQMKRDADRSGASRILGNDEVNKRIKASLAPLDALQERIYNKDVGGYTRLAQDLKGINEEAQKGLLTHPKLGPYLQMAQGLKEIGGEANLQKFSLDVIKGDFPSDLKTYFTQWRNGIATQQRIRNGENPITFNDVIDDIKAKGIKDKKLNVAVLKEVNKITDGSVPEEIRLNYAQAAFSSGNRGMISKLAEGEGQQKVFQDFTSPAMTQSMFELGKKNPQIWKNYVDWTQETLANELINKEINGLSQIRNPHIRVGWDTENKRFVTAYDSTRSASEVGGARYGSVPQYGSASTDTEYQNVIRMTNRMNSQLSNYKNVAVAAGIDPDAFILKTIAASNPEALQNVNSIPYQILRDIGLSKQKGVGSK